MEFTTKEVSESKKLALEKIKKFLASDNVDDQFNDISGEYYSSDKFIVTWNANWNGIPSEFSIDKCSMYSGYKAIYAVRGLFHEKQLSGYSSIERALIEVGLKLCPKKEREEFFKMYATKYNAKIKTQFPK